MCTKLQFSLDCHLWIWYVNIFKIKGCRERAIIDLVCSSRCPVYNSQQWLLVVYQKPAFFKVQGYFLPQYCNHLHMFNQKSDPSFLTPTLQLDTNATTNMVGRKIPRANQSCQVNQFLQFDHWFFTCSYNVTFRPCLPSELHVRQKQNQTNRLM